MKRFLEKQTQKYREFCNSCVEMFSCSFVGGGAI